MPRDAPCIRTRSTAHQNVSHCSYFQKPTLNEATVIFPSTREDVVLPLKWPIKSADGKSEIREFPLRKNTGIIISIINANTSKEIWGEDAYEWKPERWIGKSPDEVAKTRLPGVYSSM